MRCGMSALTGGSRPVRTPVRRVAATPLALAGLLAAAWAWSPLAGAQTTVTLSADKNSVEESDAGTAAGTVTITAALSAAAASGAVVIPIRVKAGSVAVRDRDFTLPLSITIPQNASSGNATFTVRDDDIREPDESVTVEAHTLPTGVTAGTTTEVTITIGDDDPVAVDVLEGRTVAEGGNAVFTLYTKETLTADLAVQVTLSDLVETFADGFTHAMIAPAVTKTQYLTIPMADDVSDTCETTLTTARVTGVKHCRTVTVGTVNDSQDEPDGQVQLRLAVQKPDVTSPGTTPANYLRSPIGAKRVRVTDNDATTVTLTATAGRTVVENGEKEFTLTVSRPLASDEYLVVPLTLGGTATLGTNPKAAPGREPAWDWTLECSSPGPGVNCGSHLGGSTRALTVGTGSVPIGNATVAIQGQKDSMSRVVTAKTVTLTLKAVADRVDSEGENATIALDRSNVKGEAFYRSPRIALGGGITATPATAFTIAIDDQPENRVTLSISGSGAAAEGGRVTVTATLAADNTTGAPIAIPIGVRGDSTAGAGDYTLAGRVIDIPAVGMGQGMVAAGMRSGSVSLSLTDDNRDEPDETVVVEVLADELPAVGGVQVPATGAFDLVVIEDNEPTDVLLTTSDTLAEEGDRNPASIEISLGRPLRWRLTRTTGASGPVASRAPEQLTVRLSISGGENDAGANDAEDGAGLDFTVALAARGAGSSEGVTLAPVTGADPPEWEVVFGLPASCAPLPSPQGCPEATAGRAVLELEGAEDFDIDDNALTVSLGALTPVGLDGGVDPERDGNGRIDILDNDETRVSFATAGPDAGIPERQQAQSVVIELRPPPDRDTEIGFIVSGSARPGTDYEIAGLEGNEGTIRVDAEENRTLSKATAMIAVNILADDVDELDETLTLELFADEGYMLDPANKRYVHTLNLLDNDTAGFDVTPASLDLREDGLAGCYSIRLRSDPAGTVTVVPRSTDRSTATVEVVDSCGGRPAQPPDRLSFTGGAGGNWNEYQVVRVTPGRDPDGNDEVIEILHTVLNYEDGEGDEVGVPDLTVTIRDSQPTACFERPGTPVRVTAADGCSPSGIQLDTVREGGTTEVTVVLRALPGSPAPAAPTGGLEVSYSVSGSADAGGDYVIDGLDSASGTGSVRIPAGGDSVTVRVRVADDDIAEGPEQAIFALTLTDAQGYALGGSTLTLPIGDTDEPGLTVSPFSATAGARPGSPLRLREGGAPVCYEISLATDPVATVTVSPESSNTAVATVEAIADGDCDDPRAPAAARLVFDENNWDVPQRVRVTPAGDADSADGTALIRHFVRGYRGIETIPEVRVEVIDHVEADFGAATSSTVAECRPAGGGCAPNAVSLDIRLTRPPAADEDIRIGYTVAGTATPGRDFAIDGLAGAAGVVRVEPGERAAVLRVEILDDRIVEDEETVIVALTPLPGPPEEGSFHTVGASSIHTIAIVDDDGGPGVTVAPTVLSIAEGGANAAYTVVLNTDPEREVGIALDSGNSDSVTLSAGALVFSLGEWNVPQSVIVSALDDPDGADERATIFHAVTNYPGVTSAPSVDVTVIDDDDDLADTVVSIVGGGAIAEGGLAEFTVSATPVPEEALTVNVTVADSGDFADGGQAGRRPVIVGSDGTAILTVATVDDASDEPDGELTATLEAGRDYTVAKPPADSATVAVADDDDAARRIPRASFVDSAARVGETGGAHEVTVLVNPSPESSIALNYTLGGTAAADADYIIGGVNEGAGAIAVAAGADSVAIPVTIIGDSLVEGAETLTLTLAPGRGYEVGGAAVYTLTIDDDDSAGVTVSTLSLSLAEGGANGRYTVALATDPGGAVTVTPSVEDPGAAAVSGALSFTSANWRAPQTVVVSALDDADADDEAVTISHRVSGYPGVASGPDVAVTVTDDDVDLGDPVVSIAAGQAIEEGGLATFTLTAAPPPRAPFNVNVTVTDSGGFAAFGQAGARPVPIGVGGTATLTVATVDDLDREADGEITATIGPGGGYATAEWPGNRAAVEVADNDGPPTIPEVALAEASANRDEAAGAYVVTVRIDPAIDTAFSLNYTLSGTASPGTDYTVAGADGAGGTVEVAAGAASAGIEVAILDDGVNEPPETAVLTLAAAAAYTVAADGGAHTLTIADNDAAAGLRAQAAPALGRLGRSLSEQLIEGVRGRLASRQRAADSGGPPTANFTVPGLSGLASAVAGGRFGDLVRGAVAGSSFLGAGPGIGGGQLGFWGRGAGAQIAGAAGDFSLNGDLTSVQLGADWTGAWLTAGLMVSQGAGEGSYRQGGVEGVVELTLSSLTPYVGYRLGERVSLWGAVSGSVGDFSLRPAGGEEVGMDLAMSAAALGGRGEVYGGAGGFSLSVVSDLFAFDAETDPAAGLPDAQAGASRFRLAAEGAWRRDLPIGGRLTNRTELGARVDSGDAGEGYGVEMSSAVSLAGNGFTAELAGRRLLLHSDESFSLYGVAIHLAWDPAPDTAAGPVATLRHGWGIDTASGVGQLHRMRDLAGFAAAAGRDPGAAAGRASLELGWGVPWLGHRYVLTPAASYGAAGTGVGLRLAPSEHNRRDLSAGIAASLPGPARPDGGALAVEFRMRW